MTFQVISCLRQGSAKGKRIIYQGGFFAKGCRAYAGFLCEGCSYVLCGGRQDSHGGRGKAITPCSATRSCSQQWRVLPTQPDDKEIARERLLIKDPLRDNPLVSRHTRRDKGTSPYFLKHSESSFFGMLWYPAVPHCPYAQKWTSQIRNQGAV